MAYFLVSVSSRRNLDLCVRYALAGFTNSVNGVWTYCDIEAGDYMSFLYGARAHNLYRVEAKEALREAHSLPPWEAITFRMSGLSYYFPFRLRLQPVRQFAESLVRAEFAYVAENLLLRGGYRKTHFQADQTTLQAASQLGSLCEEPPDALDIGPHDAFEPRFTRSTAGISVPETFLLRETVLQAALRQRLADANELGHFLTRIGVDAVEPSGLEVLGEKALPEGHIDLLVKEATPMGKAQHIIIEVKTGQAKRQDVDQLRTYVDGMGKECVAGVLIARGFSKRVLADARAHGIATAVYDLAAIQEETAFTFDELKRGLRLAVVA